MALCRNRSGCSELLHLHTPLNTLLSFAHLCLQHFNLFICCQIVSKSITFLLAVFTKESSIVCAVCFYQLLDVVIFPFFGWFRATKTSKDTHTVLATVWGLEILLAQIRSWKPQ